VRKYKHICQYLQHWSSLVILTVATLNPSLFNGLCCGQSEAKIGVGAWLSQTSVSFTGCVEGAKLIHFPKITHIMGENFYLKKKKKETSRQPLSPT
jgi:hypothetical protein